jgi:hypothetical protein
MPASKNLPEDPPELPPQSPDGAGDGLKTPEGEEEALVTTGFPRAQALTSSAPAKINTNKPDFFIVRS